MAFYPPASEIINVLVALVLPGAGQEHALGLILPPGQQDYDGLVGFNPKKASIVRWVAFHLGASETMGGYSGSFSTQRPKAGENIIVWAALQPEARATLSPSGWHSNPEVSNTIILWMIFYQEARGGMASRRATKMGAS